jgi:hypothetical protein
MCSGGRGSAAACACCVAVDRKFPSSTLEKFPKIGRDDRIRTCDPLTPSQVRYQAALHPVLIYARARFFGKSGTPAFFLLRAGA